MPPSLPNPTRGMTPQGLSVCVCIHKLYEVLLLFVCVVGGERGLIPTSIHIIVFLIALHFLLLAVWIFVLSSLCVCVSNMLVFVKEKV